MSWLLLDTNVVSYLFKGDSRAAAYAPLLNGNELAISMMTVAELFQWAAMRDWGLVRLQALESLMNRFAIMPIDVETCRFWAVARAGRAARGEPISPQDAWIAATCLRHRLPLVTHNTRDYQNIPGLIILDPLSSSA